MLKFYLETVLIYFLMYIATGILFKKEFIKARDKIRKELNYDSKIQGTIRTTITYLIISFIPFIRFLFIFCKFWLMANTDDYIKIAKEKQDKTKE